MKTCRVVIADNGRTLADLAEIALTARERLMGLMGRDGLPPGEGLLIPNCRSIHTCCMRFPIDVVYISSRNAVVKIVEDLKPLRLSACWGAQSVLEMASGWTGKMGLCVGNALLFRPLDEAG
jgi:hypothetical protein